MLRIVSKVSSKEEFVSIFHRFCDEDAIFIVTRTPKEVGSSTRFNITLSDGAPMLAGLGTVREAHTGRDNRFERPGMLLEFTELTEDSRSVLDALRDAREQAKEAAVAGLVQARKETAGPAAGAPKDDSAAPARSDDRAPRAAKTPDGKAEDEKAGASGQKALDEKKTAAPSKKEHAASKKPGNDAESAATTRSKPAGKNGVRGLHGPQRRTAMALPAPPPGYSGARSLPGPPSKIPDIRPPSAAPVTADDDEEEDTQVADERRAREEQSDDRTAGSEFILPANPFGELTEDALEAFVECTLYEDSGMVEVPSDQIGDEDEGSQPWNTPSWAPGSATATPPQDSTPLPPPATDVTPEPPPGPENTPIPPASAAPSANRTPVPPASPGETPPPMAHPGAIPAQPGAPPPPQAPPGAMPPPAPGGGAPVPGNGAGPGLGHAPPPGQAPPPPMQAGPPVGAPAPAAVLHPGGPTALGARRERSRQTWVWLGIVALLASIGSFLVGYLVWGGGDDPGPSVAAPAAGVADDPETAEPADVDDEAPLIGDEPPDTDDDGDAPSETEPLAMAADDITIDAGVDATEADPADEAADGDGAEPSEHPPEPAVADDTAPADAPGRCQVSIKAYPDEVRVAHGDRTLGKAPLATTLPCGRSVLTFTRVRYENDKKRVVLRPDRENRVRIRLRRPTHVLKIATKPSGANVFVNGRRIGRTPLSTRVKGYQSSTIRLKRRGYQVWTDRVYVGKRVHPVRVRLKRAR